MRSALRQTISWLAGAGLAAAVATAAPADEGRRVVMPGSTPAESPPAKAQADEGVDLVGPTESQRRRAKAAAEAKAKADEEARLKAEAQARAKTDAEARIKAEADHKIREAAEAKARAEAERKAREETARKLEEERLARLEKERKDKLAADQRAQAEQEAKARIEAEVRARLEAERVARVEAEAKAKLQAERIARKQVEAKARAEEQARARASAEEKRRLEIEAQVKAEVEARMRAETAKEAKARARAEAKAKVEADRKARAEARTKAKADAKARREAKRRGKKAQPENNVVPLPEVPPALVAEPQLAALKQPEAPKAQPAFTTAKPEGTQLAMAMGRQRPVMPVNEPPPAASRTIAIPHDEQQRPRRQIDVEDALQIGPQGLVLNRLGASADLLPGSLPVRGTFAYRLASDDAGALHHLFVLGAESGRDAEGNEREWRWSGSAGLSPRGTNSFGASHKAGATVDTLGWSAFVLSAGGGRSFAQEGGGFALSADAQLQGLSVWYTPGVAAARPLDAGIDQLRLRAAGTAQSGRVTGLFQLGAYLYLGGQPDSLRSVPLRGALFDDDLGGLASAPQSFLARLGGRVDLAGQLAASLSYTYLGYSSANWTSAHLVHGELSDRFGRVKAALGFTWQYDAPTVASPGSGVGDYSSLFLTGSIGYAF